MLFVQVLNQFGVNINLLTKMIEKAYIEKIASEITKEYIQSPKRLVEDARTEVNLVESEQGRFILELLQNADDAQISENSLNSDYFGQPQIIFEVTEKFLYCANGGYPISNEGLESICRAFLSPKRKNTPVIGFKGIGFKSVLSFTDKPEIFWHNNAVSFSREKTLAFLKSQAPDSLKALSTYKNDGQVPILRLPHLLDFEKEVAADATLASLLSTSATVFRFPFSSDNAKQVVMQKISDINASMVLFMNNITNVKIIVDDSDRIYTISKAQVSKETDNRTIFEEERSSVNDGDTLTQWQLISGTFALPAEIREKLPVMWKDTESVKISFAIALDSKEKYAPLSGPQLLHVFFPTQERTPFQMLLHGTFRTNVDRRLLVQDDFLNEFALTKTAELFRDKVLSAISRNIEEPGQILDFICPPAESNVSTIEQALWNRIVETLSSFPFVPNRNNTKTLAPDYVLISPLKTDIELLKSVFLGDYAARLCYDSIDSNEKRRYLLEKMGACQFNVLELPELLESSFKSEVEWVATTYSVLDKVHNYLKAVDSSKDNNFVSEIKKRNLLLLSDNSQASPESTTEIPIFFPPSGNAPMPPRDLKLRFLDGKAVEEYRKMTSLTIRGTFLYQVLNIDEYGAISLIAKTVIPAIKEFWKKWPEQALFEPEKLLEFMQTLLHDDLPEDARIKAKCLMPVPITGDKKYAPAYSVYASREWTNNDNLEFIYGESNFLSGPYRGMTDEDKQDWGKFYQWLGVSWLPRIIPEYEPFTERYYHDWYGGHCSGSPHSSLPFWENYTESVYQEHVKLGDSPLSKDSVRLSTSWCLDRFDQVITDPVKCLRILSVIASNWDNYYSHFSECDIQWKNSREWYWKDSRITSYFYWRLKNTNWLPASNYVIWSFRKPSEMFLKSKSVFDKLGDLVPYIYVEEKDTTSFILRLGVRNSLDMVSPDDWWRIAIDIPRLFPPDPEVINPIYREILKTKGIEEDSEPQREFMENGKLLVQRNGSYQFEERDDVWYSKSEETGRLFGPKLPMFSIKNDENKGAAIKRIFEIKMLDDSVESNVELGDEDDSASVLLQTLLTELKPYVLARVNKQRPSKEKEDASLLRRLTTKALKSLRVSYTLTLAENSLTEISSGGVYLDETKNVLYVDVSKFGAKDLSSIQGNAHLASEIGNCIASYLDIDLADSFILLTQAKEEQRPSILQRVGIFESEIRRMRELLRHQSFEKAPEVTLQVQGASEKTEHQPTATSEPPAVQQTTVTPSQPVVLELWSPGELEFGDIEEVQPNSATQAPHCGGSGGGQSQPAHVTNKEERSRIDQAGIKCVEKYERWRHNKEHGCTPNVESKEKEKCGFDLLSKCEKEERRIEVKSSRGEVQVIEMTATEWDAARTSAENKAFYLYRVTNLAKSSGKEPGIIIISEPYNNLLGEPTRFKVRLSYLKGKKSVVHLKKTSEPETETGV